MMCSYYRILAHTPAHTDDWFLNRNHPWISPPPSSQHAKLKYSTLEYFAKNLILGSGSKIRY